MLKRLLGRKNNRRAIDLAAKHWNDLGDGFGSDFEGRKEEAKRRVKEEAGSIFTAFLIKIALMIAFKWIERWADQNLFSAVPEEFYDA